MGWVGCLIDVVMVVGPMGDQAVINQLQELRAGLRKSERIVMVVGGMAHSLGDNALNMGGNQMMKGIRCQVQLLANSARYHEVGGFQNMPRTRIFPMMMWNGRERRRRRKGDCQSQDSSPSAPMGARHRYLASGKEMGPAPAAVGGRLNANGSCGLCSHAVLLLCHKQRTLTSVTV